MSTSIQTSYKIIFTADRKSADNNSGAIISNERVVSVPAMGDDWYMTGVSFTKGYTKFNVETARKIIKTSFPRFENVKPIFALDERGEHVEIPKN